MTLTLLLLVTLFSQCADTTQGIATLYCYPPADAACFGGCETLIEGRVLLNDYGALSGKYIYVTGEFSTEGTVCWFPPTFNVVTPCSVLLDPLTLTVDTGYPTLLEWEPPLQGDVVFFSMLDLREDGVIDYFTCIGSSVTAYVYDGAPQGAGAENDFGWLVRPTGGTYGNDSAGQPRTAVTGDCP